MLEPQGEPVLYTQAGCAESAKVRSWLTDHRVASPNGMRVVIRRQPQRLPPPARSPHRLLESILEASRKSAD